jgi:hypothetical protein
MSVVEGGVGMGMTGISCGAACVACGAYVASSRGMTHQQKGNFEWIIK